MNSCKTDCCNVVLSDTSLERSKFRFDLDVKQIIQDMFNEGESSTSKSKINPFQALARLRDAVDDDGEVRFSTEQLEGVTTANIMSLFGRMSRVKTGKDAASTLKKRAAVQLS
jgi:hypothetical protein